MRFLNISGIVLSVVLFITTIILLEEVSRALWSDWDYNSYSSYGTNYAYREMTFIANVTVLLFTLFFTTLYIVNLIKVKTVTTKVLSIIGLSISFIYLLASIGLLFDDAFGDIGGIWCFYAMLGLALSIVFLVQTIKFQNKGRIVNLNKEEDLLDEMLMD